jgi:hypothetical protein
MGLACGMHSRYEKFLQLLGGRIQVNIPRTVWGTYAVLIWVPQQKCGQDGARPALTNFPFYVLFSYLFVMCTVCV